MATIIPCNLIEQESDRLLQLFRSCYTLTGTDMDDLVNLAYSASLCGTGEGTIPTFDQNNIFTYISAISETSTNISPIDALNAREQFEVDEKEIIIYIHRYYDESSYMSKLVNDYYFIRTGKGTYGVGGTVLGVSNIFKIRGHVVAELPSTAGTTLPPRVLGLFADTVLGATINTPHTVLNGQSYSVTIQDIEDTYFVIYESKTAHNEYNIYRFTGVAGDYGSGPDTSVLGDFVLVETISDEETNPPISNGQIKIREINIPAVIGTTGISDIADAVNLSPFKGPINVSDNEILMLVVDRINDTADVKTQTLVTEKWLWNNGEYLDIGNGSTIDDYYKIETVGTTLVDGTAFTNNPEIYYTTWKDLSTTTTAAAAVNALSGVDRVVKNDNLVLVRIADDIGSSTYKVWEFIGANGTYGVAGLTAVAGDFNGTPLVDSTDNPTTGGAVTASDVFYEDTVTNLDAKDVQTAIEKLKDILIAASPGSPFDEITTGDPNYIITTDAYRSARVGLGSIVLPTEMFHLVSTQALAKGGIKVDYTYTGGGITRQQIGGQAIYSELGAVANSIEGFNTEYFANTTDYVDNLRAYVRAGDYEAEDADTSLSSSIGVVSATYDRYGMFSVEAATNNDDKDWITSLKVLNEDNDSATVNVRSKGVTSGFLLESQLEFISTNSEADESKMFISPHILTFNNLTQLSGYGSGTFIEGYTHTDSLAKTGVTATVIGAPMYFLSIDANGILMEEAYAAGLEALDEGNGIGWRLLGRDALSFGNIGLNAVDMSYSTGASSSRGATGTRSLAMGRNATASGEDSIAFGFDSIASGDFSTAFVSCTASGLTSFAQGSGCLASGSRAIAMGFEATATTSQSVAIGQSVTASAFGAVALGQGNFASTPGELSAGAWGTSGGVRAFNIGVGVNDATRLDGLTLTTAGVLTIPQLTIALIDAESTGRVAVTREYLENRLNTIKLTLTAVDIKALGSTPIDLVLAQGAGTIVKLKEVIAKLNWNTVAFDANNLVVKTVGAVDSLAIPNLIGEIADTIQGENNSLTNTLVENAAVQITGVDSVATGDSTIDIYATFEIITL